VLPVSDVRRGDQFPPADVSSVKFYLDGRRGVLTADAPTDDVPAQYAVASNPNAVSFPASFDEETVLVGYPRHISGSKRGALTTWTVRARPEARPLRHVVGAVHHAEPQRDGARCCRHGATVLKYMGSDGRLRASVRHLDETLATDQIPARTFDRVEKLSPDEIVELEIDLLPIGLTFHPGEQLRFVVSSRNLLGTLMPGIQEYVGRNEGHTSSTPAARTPPTCSSRSRRRDL